MNFIKSRTGVNIFTFAVAMIIALIINYFWLYEDGNLFYYVFASFCISIGTMLGVNSVLPKINPVLYQKRKKA
ncbi:MAG: hypothetical protein ABFD00_03885 [Chloroherpetonaceae bacterium]